MHSQLLLHDEHFSFYHIPSFSYLCGTSWAFFSRGKPLLLWRGVEVALILWFWDEMMIIIVVYAVTESSIKTAILASTQMLATQNRASFRWGLHISLVWISKPVISCIEEEALSLSVFTIVFVFFFCCCHIFDPSLYCLSPFLPVLCHCFIAMSLGGIMPLQVLRIQLITL